MGWGSAIDRSPSRETGEIGAPKLIKNLVLMGLSSWPLKGYEDILIFYVVQPDALRVVRVRRSGSAGKAGHQENPRTGKER